MLEEGSGFVQMGSGEHSGLQSRSYHSSGLQSGHKEDVGVKEGVPATKV